MTNKEKAIEIGGLCGTCISNRINGCRECEERGKYLGALEMAEWKDQQFKEYLEKKLNEVEQCEKCSIGLFPNDVIRYNGAIEVINEIINELFPKSEETDNSNRED